MEFRLTKADQLDGHFYHIFYTLPQNQRDIVEIIPSSSYYGDPYALMNYTDTDKYVEECFSTLNKTFSNITFKFPNNKMRITHYGFKTRTTGNMHFLKSWKLLGSVNGNDYEELDSKTNVNDLVGLNKTKTYRSKIKGVYTSFRIVQTGVNSDNDYYFVLNNVEFFGTFCSSDSQNCPLPSISTHYTKNDIDKLLLLFQTLFVI